MKTKCLLRSFSALALLALSILALQFPSAFAQGTAFTYQGRLDSGGVPYIGSAEFQPTLWDAASNGNQVAINSPPSVVVNVTNGLFVLPLNFGDHFPGADRWLQLEVRTTLGPFTVLSPRQQITPTPYAIYSASAATAASVTSNSVSAAQLATISSPNAGQVLAYDGSNMVWTNPVNGSAGWALSGNSGTSPTNGNFIGTTDDQPLEFKVNSLRVVRWERQTNTSIYSSVSPNLIGGFESNTVANGVSGATIAGGGGTNWYGSTPPNTINGSFSSIGGGVGNVVNGVVSTIAGGERGTIGTNAYNAFLGGGAWNSIDAGDTTIGGGRNNAIQPNAYASTISGGNGNSIRTNSLYATIGGGAFNTVQTNSNDSTIGGGYGNVVQGNLYGGTIAGGYQNSVSGSYSTVPGGYLNAATGPFSFAAGSRAKANHDGAFVWSDASSTFDFASTTMNQFSVRANGGVRFVTGGTGLTLDGPAQASSFTSIGTGVSVFGDIGLTSGSAAYHRLELSGGNSTGFLFGSFPYFGDGVHLGYNFYADADGNPHVINSGGASSRITAGYGQVVLAVGDVNFGPNNVRLSATASGVAVYGTFNNSSDRNAKQDFVPISPSEILEKVTRLPLSEWSYKEDAATRHIGPMGQDFYSTFKVGTDERHIAPIDEGGVALAAIQGLNRKLAEELKQKETEITELKARMEKLEQLINSMKGEMK